MARQSVMEVYQKVMRSAQALREAGREEKASELYWVAAELENTSEVNPE